MTEERLNVNVEGGTGAGKRVVKSVWHEEWFCDCEYPPGSGNKVIRPSSWRNCGTCGAKRPDLA